jgi:ribosome-binding factor A
MRRVNESVRAVVADAVGDLQDPRLGIVTVTGVSVSPDLHDAKVFVSVYGGEKKRKASLAALESARGIVQARLARELQMKRTPHLAFEYDPSVEYGVRMTQLIDQLAPEAEPPPDDRPDDSGAD